MTQDEMQKIEGWIEKTFFEYERKAPFCDALMTEVCTHFASKRALIQDFRKYIEE